MMKKRLGCIAVVFVLGACSTLPDPSLRGDWLAEARHLQQRKSWYFQGRLALVSERDSVSASINWRHGVGRDDIELVGPLDQGRVAISVAADKVVIDDGETRQEYPGRANVVMAERLGMDMPIDALKFWVLGVNDPRQSIVEQQNGFYQEGWSVKYGEMQRVGVELLPKKMTAEKDKVRVKLIIDQWELL